MEIYFKKLTETAKVPFHGSAYAAGYDLYLDGKEGEEITINGGCGENLHTGIAVSIPNGYFGAIYPRSGLASKKKLRLRNCVGVVDPDYRGEVIVPLYNDGVMPQTLKVGDRIAQIIFQPYSAVDWIERSDLDMTERGAGGFGSTGGVQS